MPNEQRPLKVFLCHASADKQKVRELYRYLRRRGIKPWFDEMDLVGGQDWQVEIPKALATSDAIIICLTKNSVDKEGYIQKEIKFALDKALEMPEGRIFLIPVRFEECEVPFSLSRYQWVDLFDDVGYARMMRALKFRAAQLERATVKLPKKDIEEEKLALERVASEKEEREAAEKAARDKEEYEKVEKAAREKLEREAAEKARLETEEQLRQKAEKEKAEREKSEKKAAEKESFEKIRLEADEQARQKATREKVEREITAEPKAGKPKSVEESPARKTSQVAFWTIGFIAIIFIISILALNNRNRPTTLVPTSTGAPSPTITSEVIVSPTKSFTSIPAITSTNTIVPTSTDLPTEFIDAKGVTMRLVPQGEFTMGSNRKVEQQPISKVILDAFYIDKFEVSNLAYKACVELGICQPPQDTSSFTRPKYFGNPEFDTYPVIHIDWDMAKTYCEWRDARLPTEAEWEKAARGVDERLFPWGETVNCSQANYKNDFSTFCVGDTAPIGNYGNGQSLYGVYDMAGNVAEWVADWYRSYPGNESNFSREERVVRGGSWFSFSASIYTSYRSSEKPNLHTYGTGFRCARDVSP